MTQHEGLILQGIGGFYYVESEGAEYTCKARGLFRRQGITPLAGDRVSFSEDGGEGWLEAILPRKNMLVRPPVANLDCLVMVVSVTEPTPSPLIIDQMIAVAEDKEIEPVVVMTKSDLADGAALEAVYAHLGLPFFSVCVPGGQDVSPVKEYLSGKVCAFTGNSGVGKTTLLNAMDARLSLETGEISRKLGRGRHTTRSVRLFKQDGGGYIADTPGFSQLELQRADDISKENLIYCFREFLPYVSRCRFASCAHVGEAGCAVGQAVADGRIARSRHESYKELYKAAGAVPDWKK